LNQTLIFESVRTFLYFGVRKKGAQKKEKEKKEKEKKQG
jgi:hypothetical protein